MKTILTSSLLILAVITCWLKPWSSSVTSFPPPTDGTIVNGEGEEEGSKNDRLLWIENMHRAAPGTNWRALEYQTKFQRHRVLASQRAASDNRSACGVESFANDLLTAEWHERGSNNQAGSVLATEYDGDKDLLYLISAGGTLWKGNTTGDNWQVINQDIQFEGRFLRFLETTNGRRFLAVANGIPHYSDDEGNTWTAATGFPMADNWGNSVQGQIMQTSGNPAIFFLSKPDYWSNIRIYQSLDNGQSFQVKKELSSNSFQRYQMVQPQGSNEVLLMESILPNRPKIYRLHPDSANPELLNQCDSLDFSNGVNANLAAVQVNDTLVKMFSFADDPTVPVGRRLWMSEDYGKSWTKKGRLPTNPWEVGVFVSKTDPDFLMYGDIECYRSLDGGNNWSKVNGWGDYYGNVSGKLHADMMYFNEVSLAGVIDIWLISNHGGLSISTDKLATTQNISLGGLNVSQYYDVTTDPLDEKMIFAGSQDQGFQRGKPLNDTDPVYFDQVISGDYGHNAFSENGKRLWTVYPGGSVSYYHSPRTAGPTAGFEINSDNETVWIPPLVTGPDPEKNEVYLAGGNINGGAGSYLIKLSYNAQTGSIEKSQLDFDFHDNSAGGTISYLAFSPLNPNHWYVSTTNGRFFYSTDGGNNWEQSVEFIPDGNYLYGASIYPSKVDENAVYFGGSGYSNPPVLVTYNNGFSFNNLSQGLPPTLVFELDGNEDDSEIYAASESGPFVFIRAENRWYDLTGPCTPTQTYWSVEYLENSRVARFGTYGRGIWDFAITEKVATTEPTANEQENSFQVFPNPATDQVTISVAEPFTQNTEIQLLSLNGRLLKQYILPALNKEIRFNLGDLPKGIYHISILTRNQRLSQKVVLF